jgi:hypothetical protein
MTHARPRHRTTLKRFFFVTLALLTAGWLVDYNLRDFGYRQEGLGSWFAPVRHGLEGTSHVITYTLGAVILFALASIVLEDVEWNKVVNAASWSERFSALTEVWILAAVLALLTWLGS